MLERSAIFKTASPTATLPAPGSGRDPGSHGLRPLYHTQGCSKVRGGSDFAGGVQGPDQWALRGGGHVDHAVGPEEPPQPSDPKEGTGAGAVGGAPSTEPPGRVAVGPAASAPPRQPLDSDQPPGTGLPPRAPRRETRAAVSRPVYGRLSQRRSRAGSPARHCGHFLSCGTGPSPSASPRLSAATTSDPWTGSPAEVDTHRMARDHGDISDARDMCLLRQTPCPSRSRGGECRAEPHGPPSGTASSPTRRSRPGWEGRSLRSLSVAGR